MTNNCLGQVSITKGRKNTVSSLRLYLSSVNNGAGKLDQVVKSCQSFSEVSQWDLEDVVVFSFLVEKDVNYYRPRLSREIE